MRFAERLDTLAEKEERPESLSQLSNASVKAARAVRQIAVLQLEIAGERPLPNSRAPAAPANDDRDRPYPNGPRPEAKPWEHGDYTDYDDYTDDERWLSAETKVDSEIERLERAMHADFEAAGRGDVCKQAPVTKFKLILGIPHPALDECIKTVDYNLLRHFVGPENLLPPALGPGPPNAWAEYDAKEKRLGGPNRLDSS
jgi:hypothetical protein